MNNHQHNRDKECAGCISCRASGQIFSGTDDERKEANHFRREITFLAVGGTIFFAAFVAEELLLFHSESMHKLLHALFALLYAAIGWPVLKSAAKSILRGDIFNEFTLMSTATLAAFAIGETCETVGVMLFYRIGEALQERAAANSRRAIKSLHLNTHLESGAIKEKETLQTGCGEIITTAGRVAREEPQLSNSRAASGAPQMASTERFITKFAKWYTPVVFFASAAVMLIPPLSGCGSWHEWIYRALVLLVVSCPCALVISIPLGYFGGIGAASKYGIIVKSADSLDALSKVDKIVFDKPKTGAHEKETLKDSLSAETVKALRSLGIKGIYMLTGDSKKEAERTASELSLDGFRAELSSSGKKQALLELCGDAPTKAIYVGSGIHDGSLIASTVNESAMESFGFRPAAESSDAVIVANSPRKVTDLLRIAKKTRAIVWENVALALAVKAIFIILGASGHATLWEAVFADAGAALLAIINASRTSRVKYSKR